MNDEDVGSTFETQDRVTRRRARKRTEVSLLVKTNDAKAIGRVLSGGLAADHDWKRESPREKDARWASWVTQAEGESF